jgi:pimeloyl-ACP methyl ester carboxylesterase
MVGSGMVSWRMIGGEVAALATAVLSMPLRWLVVGEHLDRTAPDEPPVVFVHGLLGDPTNFIVLRRALGGRSFTSFAYAPRLDYQCLAAELGRRIEGICEATGVPKVDVVGHSLGGLVAHYLVATGPDCGHLGLLYHPTVLDEVAAYPGGRAARAAMTAVAREAA